MEGKGKNNQRNMQKKPQTGKTKSVCHHLLQRDHC